MERIKLLVVEHDPIRREGFLSCLTQEQDFMVIGSGADFVEALETISVSVAPDVVLINMDQVTKMRSWSILGIVLPDVRIVGLTEGTSDRILVKWLRKFGHKNWPK